MIRKTLVWLLVVLMMTTGCCNGLAGTSVGEGGRTVSEDYSMVSSRLYDVPEFKLDEYSNGIGAGACAVYSAPWKDAFRYAYGKASCNTNKRVYVGGYERDGWVMICYGTSDGKTRVGYIPPSSGSKYSRFDKLGFSYVKQEAQDTLDVYDAPMGNYSLFARLDPGETYYILGKYTDNGNWWYIECTVDDQTARGFIDRNTTLVDAEGNGVYSLDMPYPDVSPYGDCEIGTVLIRGDGIMVREDAGAEYKKVSKVNYGERYHVYGSKKAKSGTLWYYIWADGVWGWVTSTYAKME